MKYDAIYKLTQIMNTVHMINLNYLHRTETSITFFWGFQLLGTEIDEYKI